MFQDFAALPLGGVPAPRASPRCPPRPAGTWQGHCLGKPARASAPAMACVLLQSSLQQHCWQPLTVVKRCAGLSVCVFHPAALCSTPAASPALLRLLSTQVCP